jgi:hypothetical protein
LHFNRLFWELLGGIEGSDKILSVRPVSPPAGTKSNAPQFSQDKSRIIATPTYSGTIATRVELRQKYNMADVSAGDGSHFLSTDVFFNFRSPNNILLHASKLFQNSISVDITRHLISNPGSNSPEANKNKMENTEYKRMERYAVLQ